MDHAPLGLAGEGRVGVENAPDQADQLRLGIFLVG
jgi:hypothetical protein